MAASDVPPGNQDGSAAPRNSNGSHSALPGAAATDYSGPAQALKHNPGLALEWSPEEQAILEVGLIKYASESNIIRYAKIAMQLQEKTVRDVALRCRWMTKKESGKRRKEDMRKNSKKEKVTDPSSRSTSHLAGRSDVPAYPPLTFPVDNNDEITYQAIGGQTGHLLEQNVQIFSQISANLSSLQIQDNINLFCRARDNILTILSDMNDMPGVRRQMPLPMKIDEDLANSILPPRSMPMR